MTEPTLSDTADHAGDGNAPMNRNASSLLSEDFLNDIACEDDPNLQSGFEPGDQTAFSTTSSSANRLVSSPSTSHHAPSTPTPPTTDFQLTQSETFGSYFNNVLTDDGDDLFLPNGERGSNDNGYVPSTWSQALNDQSVAPEQENWGYTDYSTFGTVSRDGITGPGADMFHSEPLEASSNDISDYFRQDVSPLHSSDGTLNFSISQHMQQASEFQDPSERNSYFEMHGDELNNSVAAGFSSEGLTEYADPSRPLERHFREYQYESYSSHFDTQTSHVAAAEYGDLGPLDYYQNDSYSESFATNQDSYGLAPDNQVPHYYHPDHLSSMNHGHIESQYVNDDFSLSHSEDVANISPDHIRLSTAAAHRQNPSHSLRNKLPQFADVDIHRAGDQPPCPLPVSKSHPSNTTYRAPDPHPIMCFAFGGKIVTTFVKASRHQKDHGAELKLGFHMKSYPGPVRCRPLKNILTNTLFGDVISSFCGPLTSSSKIVKLLESRSSSREPSCLLWQLVSNLAHNKGIFNGAQVSSTLTGDVPHSSGDVWLGGSQSDAGSPCLPHPVSYPKPQNDDITEIQRYVIAGQLAQACEFASSKGLWSHALVISSYCDPKLHQTIIVRYRDSFLTSGSPLHTIYGVIAQTPVNSIEYWRQNLAALYNLPRSQNAIIQLGNILLSNGDIIGAHSCFILCSHLENLSLLGCSTPLNKTFQCLSPASLQLTEVYEHSIRRHDNKFVLIPLISHKFSYACLLIDLGYIADAADYVATVIRAITQCEMQNRKLFNSDYCTAIRHIEQRLNRLTQGGGKIEKASVLGSLFDNISRLLIGKDEEHKGAPATATRPAVFNSNVTAHPEKPVAQPPVPENTGDVNTDENILTKLSGFFKKRTGTSPSSNADFEDDNEEKFVWDPVSNNWISNVVGAPVPLADSTPARVPPPPSRRSQASAHPMPRNPVERTKIASRYALDHAIKPAPEVTPPAATVSSVVPRQATAMNVPAVGPPSRPIPGRMVGRRAPPFPNQ
uniref:Protein transport protein sec16 n=1 Tax=Spongospora subterranea TaxID=70186 RepID=A0A0H5R7L7_9EUKA|eukprot:CRZ10113.1 hypothetical protein [Spongospora subterranea]